LLSLANQAGTEISGSQFEDFAHILPFRYASWIGIDENLFLHCDFCDGFELTVSDANVTKPRRQAEPQEKFSECIHRAAAGAAKRLGELRLRLVVAG
jgi:hypothetical protein